jgi:hypothetical protein
MTSLQAVAGVYTYTRICISAGSGVALGGYFQGSAGPEMPVYLRKWPRNPLTGPVYGYRLEPTDDGAATVVTSFYDWSNIDPKWRDAGIFPVLSEGALRATLGILDRTVRRGYPRG